MMIEQRKQPLCARWLAGSSVASKANSLLALDEEETIRVSFSEAAAAAVVVDFSTAG